MLRLKADPKGVRVRCHATAMSLMVSVVVEVFREVGAEAVVTSADDGRHSTRSLHWMHSALDWRTRDLRDDVERMLVRDRIQDRLGVDFDIVLESDHLHTEWQPKGPP